MSKEFTKADLKPFMLAITRNKTRFLVTDKALINKENQFIFLSDISDTLENDGGSNEYDIIEIYSSSAYLEHYLCFNLIGRELLYEREEVKKMTLREICEKLGEKIELIPEE